MATPASTGGYGAMGSVKTPAFAERPTSAAGYPITRPWHDLQVERFWWFVERDPMTFRSQFTNGVEWWPEVPIPADAAYDAAFCYSCNAIGGHRLASWAHALAMLWDDERPCPHVPLLELYRLGYALPKVENGAAWLVMPWTPVW